MSTCDPTSEAELSDAIRAAAASDTPLAIRGGGTRGSSAAATGQPLRMSGITGITLYDPGALTLVVRAGTPLAEVEAALAAEGQRLPFEPWDGRALSGANGAPSIGGMVATNASGPRRIQAGACRDSMIGVRFVDGTGAVVKNGGRVMKNVTGLDLVKLMAGSHGTLGVLTEVGFKVLPASETVATLVLHGLDVPRAVAAMTAATAAPFEVSGAAHVPDGFGDGPATLLRLEGFEGSVLHRARELKRVLAPFGESHKVDGPGDWSRLRDGAFFAGATGAVWRISVKPTDGAHVAAALPQARLVLDWAGGLVWALVPEDLDLRAALAHVPGHATLVRASTEARARWGLFHPEPAAVTALSEGLRRKFDPAGILNRGLMRSRVPTPA